MIFEKRIAMYIAEYLIFVLFIIRPIHESDLDVSDVSVGSTLPEHFLADTGRFLNLNSYIFLKLCFF